MKKKKTDSLLELALEEQLSQDPDMKKYHSDKEIENSHSFSHDHKQKRERIFKRVGRERQRIALHKSHLRIAAAFVIGIVGSFVMVMKVEAFRVPFFQL